MAAIGDKQTISIIITLVLLPINLALTVINVLGHFIMQSELDRERSAYCEHLNDVLQDYSSELTGYLPLKPENLLKKLRDGVLLTYILHYFYPENIGVSHLVRGIDLDIEASSGNQHAIFEATANLNRAVEAAKNIKGLVIVNLGSEDVLEMKEDLVLGLLWQLIRHQMLGRVNLISHPELVRLLQPHESLASLAALRAEPLLIRWFNYHLERQGASLRVNNFSKDVSTGEAYLRLISAINGESFELGEALSLPVEERIELVLSQAQGMGCTAKIRELDIASGHPRLNLVFTAGLFNANVGIHLPSEDDIRQLYGEVSGLRNKLAQQDEALEAAKPLEAELQQLRRTSVDLGQQLEELRLVHQQELRDLELSFDSYKEELAQQYQESLESALASERRLHQQELGELRGLIRETRRRALGQLTDLRGALSPALLDGTKTGEMLKQAGEDMSLEQVVALQGHLAHHLADVSARQARNIFELQAELAHKERIEQVMAAKVKEYSEQLISMNEQASQKKQEKKEPALSIFKSKALRTFMCQGR